MNLDQILGLDIITKACYNCEHGELNTRDYPCNSCDELYSRWELET